MADPYPHPNTMALAQALADVMGDERPLDEAVAALGMIVAATLEQIPKEEQIEWVAKLRVKLGIARTSMSSIEWPV